MTEPKSAKGRARACGRCDEAERVGAPGSERERDWRPGDSSRGEARTGVRRIRRARIGGCWTDLRGVLNDAPRARPERGESARGRRNHAVKLGHTSARDIGLRARQDGRRRSNQGPLTSLSVAQWHRERGDSYAWSLARARASWRRSFVSSSFARTWSWLSAATAPISERSRAASAGNVSAKRSQ